MGGMSGLSAASQPEGEETVIDLVAFRVAVYVFVVYEVSQCFVDAKKKYFFNNLQR